jgi:4-carboxymuconolactone decarboxylase
MTDTPRLAPLTPEEWSDDQRQLLEPFADDGEVLNIFATLAHHPKLLKRWLVFGGHIMVASTLPPRDRELLILRTGWRCQSPYEFGQHAVIGRQAGLTDEEIAAVTRGPDDPTWSDDDARLLTAADELVDDHRLSDATWTGLNERYDTPQVLDLIFTVGQYTLVSMALNSLGVQIEEGLEGFPDP